MTKKQVLNRIKDVITDAQHERKECEQVGDVDTMAYLDGKLYAYKHAIALLTQK
jgi:hypothetical protein